MKDLGIDPVIISAGILISTLLGIFVNAKLNKILREHDHARSRRQNAIELMKFFFSSYSKMRRGTLSFAQTLTPEQCADLEHRRRFYLNPGQEELARSYFSWKKKSVPASANKIILDAEDLRDLRFEVVMLANLLEIVAAGYVNNVADRRMIYQEFRHVYYSDDLFILDEFITATLRYPAMKELRGLFDKENSRLDTYQAIDETLTPSASEKKIW